MQIFGQVWLWSLGSFLLGVLFTWLLLVKPARKRIVELEGTTLGAPQPTRVERPDEPSDQPGPNKTDRFLDDLFEKQRPPQAPPHLPPVTPPPVIPLPPPVPLMALPEPTAPPEPPIPDESDTELSDAPFREFTQSTTVFVPPTNLPQPPEATGGGEDWFSKEDEADPQAVTDVEEDEQVDARGTIFTQHTTPIPANVIRSLDDSSPKQARHELPEQDEESSQAAHVDQADQSPKSGRDPGSARLAGGPRQPAQSDETSEFSQFAGSRSSARSDHAEQFEPVPPPSQYARPAAPPESPAEVTQHLEPAQVAQFVPAHEAASQRSEQSAPAQQYQPAQVGSHQAVHFEAPPESGRSLFEPVVPVAEHEQAVSDDDFVQPGPFGPGSAMPLPGGGPPAPEFTVKASVTALRYCTHESPQFDRIVAEVWFRTPSDAERVGFRLLS